ncbi:MAG: hypothetical protein D3926_17550 [Desulfobacteraceae bacterium]|nr:MAG: hypothetical protein D3926_17550 [Desulfobacteraceae bacterium]
MRSETAALPSIFSSSMIRTTQFLVTGIAFIMVAFWPASSFFTHAFIKGPPITFAAVFTVSLLWSAYILMCSGRGEYLLSRDGMHTKPSHVDIAEERDRLLIRTLPRFAWHTLLLNMLLVPLYILAAAASGIDPFILASAVAVVMFSGLVSRFFGFAAYLLYGHQAWKGTLVSRGCFTLFFGISGLIVPGCNPVYLLYTMQLGQGHTHCFQYPDLVIHLLFAASVMVLLIWICSVLLKRRIQSKRVEDARPGL